MDPFTENILVRARERQKLFESDKTSLHDKNNKASSQPNLNITEKLPLKEVLSDSNLLTNFKDNNSKELSCSPKEKILNIQNNNFNMEVKVTSKDDIQVEVEVIEKDINETNDNNKEQLGGLREDVKNRLNRLGKLYAGGEDANISSPIHRTEEKFCLDESTTIMKSEMNSRKGLKKLADLAENINQWEDELPTIKKIPATTTTTGVGGQLIKKKPLAPQPPKVVTPLKQKPKAPNPPIIKNDEKNTSRTTTQESTIVMKDKIEPKNLEWDNNVLETLECQGFVRTDSSSRLIYKYDSSNKKDTETVSNIITDKPSGMDQQINKLPTTKSSMIKSTIVNKAAMFESSSPSKLINKDKDPALLTVSERKALFEKNKGTAPMPKCAFGMAAPINNNNNNNKLIKKSPAPKPPILTQPKPTITQASGIASKMAALLENKTTISQEQIENNIKVQRQKEMDVLLNRFINKNKDTIDNIEKDSSDDENDIDDNIDDEKTAMIQEKLPKIIPQPPPLPQCGPPAPKRSAGKRCSKNDSPKVVAVLNDVKRIKVSPKKSGRLYPCLSDIETATETETDRSPTPTNYSSFEESLAESDEINTSFGRDILQTVCNNQPPNKRQILDESTASDLSSILDDMDDEYIDEALAYAESNGPTPPKHSKGTHTSNSFSYKNFSPQIKNTILNENNDFKSPMKTVKSPRQSMDGIPTHVMDGEEILPLKHTVSFYRRQQNQSQTTTPIKHIIRQPIIEQNENDVDENINSNIITTTPIDEVQNKIILLKEEVKKQEMIISQTSRALNLCNSTPEFMGSTEQVEAERVLLEATNKRQAILHEIQRLKVENCLRPLNERNDNLPLQKGTLTISKIVLPLKQKYVTALAAAGGKGHHVVCLLKCGEEIKSTRLISTLATNSKNFDYELKIPCSIKFNNIFSDFMITFEVYCLQAQEESLPHEIKYHITNKKTPKKSKHDSRLFRPINESPAGPNAVRSTTFALMGYMVFTLPQINKKFWTLNNTPSMSPLEGTVEMHISCEMAISTEHRGFLTMFEDISGFGAWHRRWCLLKGYTLSYWKYPDDEKKMPPIDTINLKSCITQEIGPVSRDICARLHTFLLQRERIAYPQDKDTLVMIRKGDKTIIRHLLSADTKEERIEWCNKLNVALTALQMSTGHSS